MALRFIVFLPPVFFRETSIRVPLKYPNLGTSAFVSHKVLPSVPPPQSVIPESFLEQVKVRADQKGGGADPQVEEALQNPVKVFYSVYLRSTFPSF